MTERRSRTELERRLRKVEERASLLFETNPHPIWIYDPETLAILEVNEAAVERYGYSREELTSMTLADIRPEEDESALRAAVRGELEERGEHRLWRHLTKEGETRWVEIASAPLELDGRPVRFAVVTDVTERLRAERRIAESEARLRALVEAMPDLLFVIRRDGTFEEIYGREELLTRPVDQVVGDSIRGLPIPPDKRADVLRKLRHCLDEGIIREVAYELEVGNAKRSFHGRFAPLDEERAVFVTRDVTARARAEAEVRESRKRLEAVLRQIPAVVWTTDRALRFTWAAGSGLSRIGIEPEAAEGMPVVDFFSPNEDVEEWVSHHRRALDGDSPTYEAELVGKSFVAHLEPLLGDESEPAGVIGVALDVTEEKHLQEQLRQSQKMEAVGRLAGGVAHDFNNLLTAIGGYAELALAEIPAESPVRTELEEIRRAAERAGALTGQLLAFSRQQILQPKVLDLNRIVRDVVKMLHRVIGEDVDLVTDLSPEIGRVRIDPGQLEQVLLNLVVNARDAMPEGGRLTLATREIELGEPMERPEVTIPVGSWVVLDVQDTGIGMEREIRERIFEPFFTTKEKGEGTGLGLATVYGIVKQSDGFVLVESEPEEGTRFEILLPRIEDEATDVEEERDTSEETGSERVLVVEDDAVVRDLVVSTLRRRGYHVRAAGDRSAALGVAARWERFDLLLSDLVLPDARGPDIEEELRARDHGFATLFISGYADDEASSGRLEETPFLPKPFTPSRLAAMVRKVLDARQREPR